MIILLHSLSVRHRTQLREIVLFVGVGILNTAVDFAVLNLLIALTHRDKGWWLLFFNSLSFLAAVINSYVLNGRFTFRNSSPGGPWRFIWFVGVNAIGLIINSLTVGLMSPLAGKELSTIVAINVSKALATLLSLCWNYFAIKRWIFRAETPEIQKVSGSLAEPVRITSGSETQNEI
jgi:putative flippase GtrA